MVANSWKMDPWSCLVALWAPLWLFRSILIFCFAYAWGNVADTLTFSQRKFCRTLLLEARLVFSFRSVLNAAWRRCSMMLLVVFFPWRAVEMSRKGWAKLWRIHKSRQTYSTFTCSYSQAQTASLPTPRLARPPTEILWKLIRKWYQILEKSSSGAVLVHLGHPFGAKMAQERQQDLENIKNIRF